MSWSINFEELCSPLLILFLKCPPWRFYREKPRASYKSAISCFLFLAFPSEENCRESLLCSIVYGVAILSYKSIPWFHICPHMPFNPPPSWMWLLRFLVFMTSPLKPDISNHSRSSPYSPYCLILPKVKWGNTLRNTAVTPLNLNF